MPNLDDFDPDWIQAERHAMASRAGHPTKDPQLGSTVLCKCCFNHIHKDPAPLCENSKELEFLGFGYPLFYTFLKNCIMLLICLICTYSAYALKNAITYNYNYCYDVHKRLLGGSETTCETFMIWFSSRQATAS